MAIISDAGCSGCGSREGAGLSVLLDVRKLADLVEYTLPFADLDQDASA